MWPVCRFPEQTQRPTDPGTSGFYGNWLKDVRAGQFIILGDFASAWVAPAPASVAVSPLCDSALLVLLFSSSSSSRHYS